MPLQRPPQYQETNMDFHSQRRSIWTIPISIIIAGALIGAGIYLSKTASTSSQIQDSVSGTRTIGDININPVTASDHIFGNPNAEVMIVEFSDTECPFCKDFHKTLQRVMEVYGKDGKVAWVYRHFPIDQLHKRAKKEAVATECANEIGGPAKFWTYINTIFSRTNSNDTFDPAELPQIAKELGIDQKQFNTCLNSTKYDSLILQQSQDALRSGAKGTPFTVIITSRGEKVALEGDQPYDVLKTIIDNALSVSNPTVDSN